MTAWLTVLEPGPLTTVQDLGRRGFAHLGVPRSGALDLAAARYANAKGNLRFPYDEPIPYELIEELTRLRAGQDAEETAAKRAKGAR